MSTLVETARKALRLGDSTDDQVRGLTDAVTAARGRLDDDAVDSASTVASRAAERLKLSAEHTVVAIAGATGSGKSSTFNALTGLELAAVGVRRPTTSWTTACVWGAVGAEDLLSWLGIPPRHQISRDSMLDVSDSGAKLRGLVLLDLPDHDSTEVAHHLEAERLVGLADLLIWVLDPQKYADAAIHERFLRPMSAHGDSMLVLLNHIDEVPPERREGMLGDVRRLLAQDGLEQVPVIATSATTGEGLDEVRGLLTKQVAAKKSMRQRVGTEVVEAADRLVKASGAPEAHKLRRIDHTEVVDAMADSAGVPQVVAAVKKATEIRARQMTGWPLTSWLERLRPDPLKRLHLDLSSADKDIVASARSSIPAATQVQSARVESAVRQLADQASEGLTSPWTRAIRAASVLGSSDLADQLDRVITDTDLGMAKTPFWWQLVRAMQWIALLVALGGAAWLGALAVMGWLQLPEPNTPTYLGLPIPTLMLLVGVLLGVFMALASRALVAVGANSKAAKVDRLLRDGVGEVAEQLVLEPIDAELDAYEAFYAGLKSARKE
ncbi:MAG: GTPase [Marmoricola sp.]